MDVFSGTERVDSGRINDPSRKYPGDVCVRSAADPGVIEKAIEVRDKPVSVSDVHIFGKKCIDMSVQEGALVMVSDRQQPPDSAALTQWANGFGIGLTLVPGMGRLCGSGTVLERHHPASRLVDIYGNDLVPSEPWRCLMTQPFEVDPALKIGTVFEVAGSSFKAALKASIGSPTSLCLKPGSSLRWLEISP
ncbi:MAG: restriction endonuclease, SacI family [Alphaproteobacteria bacterium]